MLDVGPSLVVALGVLIALPVVLAGGYLLPSLSRTIRRDPSPTPRSVERVATARTPRPIARVSVARATSRPGA